VSDTANGPDHSGGQRLGIDCNACPRYAVSSMYLQDVATFTHQATDVVDGTPEDVRHHLDTFTSHEKRLARICTVDQLSNPAAMRNDVARVLRAASYDANVRPT
jgi:hypothetical protein